MQKSKQLGKDGILKRFINFFFSCMQRALLTAVGLLDNDDALYILQVVEERWGSLGRLAVSVASSTAAPARAHLHAIKDRRGRTENYESVADDQTKKGTEKAHGDNREYFGDASFRHSQMREPKVHDSFSWGKRRAPKMSGEDTRLISEAVSNLNKHSNDGSFLSKFNLHQKNDADGSISNSRANYERNEDPESELVSSKNNYSSEEFSGSKRVWSSNQLAAKVLQLRMKGKHEEAEKLLVSNPNMKSHFSELFL